MCLFALIDIYYKTALSENPANKRIGVWQRFCGTKMRKANSNGELGERNFDRNLKKM